MYFDTAYIAKYYLNERESASVRTLITRAGSVYTSVLAVAEAQCVFHRQMRDGAITAKAARELARVFLEHVDEGLWNLIPAGEPLLRRAGAIAISAGPRVFLRAADAIHLITAMELGEGEIWTNDRHMLAAAPHFGLVGCTV